ncbi:MAG: phytoene desaturase family protein [Ilumatobacteraceae bacterium]
MRQPTRDHDAIVIGGGHNGLVCAAYLARAGLRTLLVEARSTVGGTASSEPFEGATVNICNCDHLTFRTTPIVDELDLVAHGLRYIDVEPSQFNMAWSGGPAWQSHHSVDATLDSLAQTHPTEVDGYRRYVRDAVPAVQLVMSAANEPPTAGALLRRGAAARGRGAATLLRWSRRSAAEVMREYFSTDALQGPGMVTGPMVWGISPEFAGTGLGALTYAFRHVGTVGRPVGGSGEVPRTLRATFEAAGGQLLTSTRVQAITCEGPAVRGVVLSDGTEVTADIVVSACNPHQTFLQWLTNAPPQARSLVERWRSIPHADGYESKIDALLDHPPVLSAAAQAGATDPSAATHVIAPSLAEMHRGFSLMSDGEVLPRPAFLANTPTVDDPSVAPSGQHVLSLEALFTPYALRGGWPTSTEPDRWLDLFGGLTTTGTRDFRDSISAWRAMTPDRYETEFHLPHGHATSFAGGPLAAFRPRDPELLRYRTAVDGLYLTGAATFPGAGVWGAAGRNAALVVLARLGLRARS